MQQCWRQNSQISTRSSAGRYGKRWKLRSGVDVAAERRISCGQRGLGIWGTLEEGKVTGSLKHIAGLCMPQPGRRREQQRTLGHSAPVLRRIKRLRAL